MVTIRPAQLEDATNFSELRMEALRDNPTAFGSSYEARENCTLDWALRVLAGDPQQERSFVAEHDGILLGMASIRRAHGRKTRHSATIAGMYVKPEWREMGIVDALLGVCFEWARSNDVIILKLAVVTVNRPALRAYERAGFRHYGTDPMVILHKGIYYDEYLLACNLERMKTSGG